MKMPSIGGSWQPSLLIALAIIVVMMAALLETAGSSSQDTLMILLFLVAGGGLIALTLYALYQFATYHYRRAATERIVVGQIATVVRQNLPLATGLALAAESEGGWARVYLRRISRLLAQGLPLSQALQTACPDCSRLVLSLAIAGERAGQLPAAMDQAAEYLLERQRRRSPDEVSVWPYLLMVGSLTVLMVSGILVAVIPKYKEIFKDFDAVLPGLTVVLINIAESVAEFGWLLIVPAILVPWGFYLSIRPRRVGRLAWTSRVADWFRWRTPGWRGVEHARSMQLALRVMRLAVRSGLSLEPAAAIAASVDLNQELSRRLRRFGDRLERGGGVREAAQEARLDPVTAVALAGGRRGGDMDAALRYAIDYHAAIAGRWWIVLRNLAWPAATLAMGLIVGFVVLAMFLPLVSLINSVSM